MDRKRDMTIVIADRGEYGRRLVDYLERELSDRVRLLLFTEAGSLEEWEGEADCCILGDLATDRKVMEGKAFRKARVIRLADEADEEGFSRYDKPGKLLDLIRGSLDRAEEKEMRISLLLCPVPVDDLAGLARKYMEEGGIYLGAEDIGSETEKKADMGDLCYYIHLHEEKILSRLEEMVREEDGCCFLDSPDLYFYLREITAEDYRWFFDRVRESGRYRDLTVGAGIGFLNDPALLGLFDRLILLEVPDQPRLSRFCERIGRIVKEDYYASGLELITEEIEQNDNNGKKYWTKYGNGVRIQETEK